MSAGSAQFGQALSVIAGGTDAYAGAAVPTIGHRRIRLLVVLCAVI
jgi:hypothetical protein